MITESRVKAGTLTLGGSGGGTGTPGTAFACQASTIKITPSFDDDGDAVETLCGDTMPAGKKESWTLNGTSIQDFDDPDGFLAYCYEHSLETVAFSWQPNIVGAPTITGNCVIRALELGGDVNARLTTDWEWDISGKPDLAWTPPAGLEADDDDAETVAA